MRDAKRVLALLSLVPVGAGLVVGESAKWALRRLERWAYRAD
jgi:hypothetical protein